MKVWYHPQTGNFMINWQVYACVEIQDNQYQYGIHGVKLSYYQYVGEACENKNGITCIFNQEYLDNFEYIGEL